MHIRLPLAVAMLLTLPSVSALGGECEPVPVSAFTADPGPLDPARVGESTRAWLNFQCSGQAAGTAHPQPGAAATRTYARYLNSFGHPIPEFYQREGFIKGGGTRR